MNSIKEEVTQGLHHVSTIPDEELLRRAVDTAKSKSGRWKEPRWATVSERFMLGSTYSKQLCNRFGFDPDEQV